MNDAVVEGTLYLRMEMLSDITSKFDLLKDRDTSKSFPLIWKIKRQLKIKNKDKG